MNESSYEEFEYGNVILVIPSTRGVNFSVERVESKSSMFMSIDHVILKRAKVSGGDGPGQMVCR